MQLNKTACCRPSAGNIERHIT